MALWAHKAGVAASFHSDPGGLTLQVVAAGSFAVGDLIVVTVSAGCTTGAMSVTSVTDNLGNTYTTPTNGTKNYDVGAGGGASSGILAVYLANNVKAGTPDIHVGMSRVSNWGCALTVDGFTGASATLDVSATPNSGSFSTNPSSNTSAATTNGNELALAVYADMGGGANNTNASGYTVGVQVSGSNDNNIDMMWKDSGTTGSTISAGNPLMGGGAPGQNWAYLILVLKNAAIPVAETGTLTDAASVNAASGTTPKAGDVGLLGDRASVAVVGDPPALPGFGAFVAPSWADFAVKYGGYRCYFYRMNDDGSTTFLTVMPVQGLQFTNLINNAGSVSFKLFMGAIDDKNLAIDATRPEDTVVIIDKGGIIVAHCVILNRTYDLPTDTLDIGGQDYWFFMSRRLIQNDLTFNGVDILEIQRELVAYTQSQTEGNLGIQMDFSLFSGYTRIRNYLAVDRQPIDRMCEELAALDPGFEFRVRAYWDPTETRVPVFFLEQAYPIFGVASNATPYYWSYPNGSILTFSWPEDGSNTARRVHALGTQQTDGTRPIAVSSEDVGYPLTEISLSFDVDGVNDLQPHADAEQRDRAAPQVLPKVTVYGAQEPLFGTYREGDHARYKITAGISGRFPDGLDSVWRITGVQVNVNEDGTENVTHMLAPAAVP